MKNLTKYIKGLVIPLGLLLIVLTPVLYFSAHSVQLTHAAEVGDVLKDLNKTSQLPSFDRAGHAQSSFEPGASNITSAILYVVDLFKYLLATIAVVIIIASGIRLITATKNIDEVAEKQKENIKYAIIGLLIIVVADVMVKQVFFGEQGEVYRSEADMQLAAQRGSEQLRGIYMFLEYFMAAITILMIVLAGVNRLTSAGNEERVTKSNKQIMWALIGISLLGISEFIVKGIVFPNQGSQLPDVQQATKLIKDITNFASGFLATAAVALYMYGGYLYVISTGKEELAGKAKKVFMGATIGLIIAMGAYALANTFIKVEPLTKITTTQETPTDGTTL